MVSQSADEKMSELESLGKHPIWLDKALTISGNTTTKEVSIKHQMLQLTLPTGERDSQSTYGNRNYPAAKYNSATSRLYFCSNSMAFLSSVLNRSSFTNSTCTARNNW